MSIYTVWRKTEIGYTYVADIPASSAEQAWRTAAKVEPSGARLVVTAEGNQKPPGLAAGQCEGVV